ncbi:MAG TPA: FtsK/SpoIIIE domain-containing protein, partial [Mycobacteriales bacterium]|nr:FtsK/SpoIIIE domain-containing protein [Mycobacteriales bacterium]
WLGVHQASYVRLGTFRLPNVTDHPELPALLPLLDVGSVTFHGDADRDWTTAALRATVLRALAAAPAASLEISVFDPKLTGALSPFGRLRVGGAHGLSAPVLSEPLTGANELLERLELLRSGALRVAELAGVHDAASLAQLREITGEQPEPYRLMVLLSYPYGIDTRIQPELTRLVRAGGARGLSFLVVTDPEAITESDIDIDGVLRHTVGVHAAQGGLRIDGMTTSPDVVVAPDSPPSRELVELVCDQVLQVASTAAAPMVEFAKLLPTAEEFGREDATDGVIAPIGYSGTNIVDIQLRGADPALPNLLVGGASGQGKSNLLLVLLHSIAARYSTDEVQMYLLDFKDGLEFDQLGPAPGRPYWLPHAKLLGLEGDRSFGLSVLRFADAEFSRRAERLRAAGANSLSALRRKNPDEIMPRLLFVIDEFQMLVADGDEIGRESISIIETLARRGRAVGIHLVLASQTLSGIDTLASKERSIFGQFPWRVSLKTEASESEAVLGRGNTEAAQLRYRGEIILNSDYGAPDRNQRAVVAYADSLELDRLRHTLWSASIPDAPPRVFYARRASDPAQLVDLLGTPHGWQGEADVDARAIVGLPIDVTDAPVRFDFRGDPGCGLAVLGDGRDDALGVLASASLALSVSRRKPQEALARFVLLDGLASGGKPTPELERLAAALGKRGHHVELLGNADIAGRLIELGQLMSERLSNPDQTRPDLSDESAVYVIGAAMHRISGLAQVAMSGESPGDTLSQLVRQGPLAKMHLLGWWNSARVFTEQLGYEASPLLAGLVFLRAPEADVQAMCGPYVRFTPRPHRGLFVDRGSGGQPREFVPFGPLDDAQAAAVGGGQR